MFAYGLGRAVGTASIAFEGASIPRLLGLPLERLLDAEFHWQPGWEYEYATSR